jgi:PPP family 3-phenylpropionic acid transporter
VIRFGLMSLEAGVAGFVMLQALHGLSFGATHLGLMHYCIKAVPEGRIGAAQAVSFVVAAIAMGMVSYVCGPLYAAFGGNAFFFMALAGASGGLLLVLGARDQPQRPESGG